VPVEPKARDAEENHCQSEHRAQYQHAAFERGDPIAQDALACVVRVQRDDFPEPRWIHDLAVEGGIRSSGNKLGFRLRRICSLIR